MIYDIVDFFMNWIAGLPITLGQKCNPILRPIFLLIALIWIPAMFLIFLPLIGVLCIVSVIIGLWEALNDA